MSWRRRGESWVVNLGFCPPDYWACSDLGVTANQRRIETEVATLHVIATMVLANSIPLLEMTVGRPVEIEITGSGRKTSFAEKQTSVSALGRRNADTEVCFSAGTGAPFVRE